jgi:hypothetical protein
LVASVLGILIGSLDAIHNPTRGRLIILGFGLTTALSAAMALRVQRMAQWDERVADDARLDGVEFEVPPAEPSAPEVVVPQTQPVDRREEIEATESE